MDGLLAAARELLGMELAYLSELRDDALVLHHVDGDVESFGGVAGGVKVPRRLSWCHAVIDGEAPSIVRDAVADPQAAVHPFVHASGIRSYAGVPVRRPDGALYGTLCCLSRTARPELGERDLEILAALARVAGRRIGVAAEAPARRRAELEATAGQALIAALNARENYTAEHSEAVLALALEVAEEMGLAGADAAEVGQVALLHDIGKVGVPDAILQKRGGLTAPEWEVMREHPVIGGRIVSAIASLSHLAPAVRAEHERWDGLGYPDGLAGEQIPLASRICFICDAWHAMTSDRPYRSGLTTGEARAEIERHKGSQFCPETVNALLRVLDRREGLPAAAPVAAATAQLPQVRPDRPLEAELRALIAVSRAVAAAHRLEEVLEIVRQQALAVLRAASISIDRWDPALRRWEPLAADAGGDRAPASAAADGAAPEAVDGRGDAPPTGLAARLVNEGRPFVVSLDDPHLAGDDAAVLERLGKGSMVSAPILVEGRVWGRLDAFAERGRPPFTPDHLRFVEALCGQVAAAIGRAELFSRLETLAFQDPLTGLPNRRALDDRLDEAVAARLDSGGELALLFCDLDGLKGINDRDGHDAGDLALRQAAGALQAAAEAYPGSLIARLGGDEFCALMDGHGTAAARALARDASRRLVAAAAGRLTFSSGVACLGGENRRPSDLFRAADAAQYAAKRLGGGRVFVAEPGLSSPPAGPPPDGSLRRRFRDAGPHEREALAASVLEGLDGELAESDVVARLEWLTGAFADAFDLAGWAISRGGARGAELRTVVAAERRDRADRNAPAIRITLDDELYAPADYTARALARAGGFCIAADDAAADPSDRRLLRKRGFTAVTATAAREADGAAWLVELFSDRRTHVVTGALTSLRLLASEAVRGAGPAYAGAATSRAKTSNTSM